MRPTPLTDAAVESVPMRGEYSEYREAQFIKVSELARSLERERAELIEALRVSLRVSSLPFDHADKRANPERLRALLRSLGEA